MIINTSLLYLQADQVCLRPPWDLAAELLPGMPQEALRSLQLALEAATLTGNDLTTAAAAPAAAAQAGIAADISGAAEVILSRGGLAG